MSEGAPSDPLIGLNPEWKSCTFFYRSSGFFPGFSNSSDVSTRLSAWKNMGLPSRRHLYDHYLKYKDRGNYVGVR